MNWTIRVSRSFLADVRKDLKRPHAHAAERIGFISCRISDLGRELLVLPIEYAPVADDHYIPDRRVGARISGDAIRCAMESAMRQNACILHVHMHERAVGYPKFSRVDLNDYPKVIRSFQAVCPDMPHGAMVLSRDSVNCLLWRPGKKEPTPGGRVVVLGRPMEFHDAGELYA